MLKLCFLLLPLLLFSWEEYTQIEGISIYKKHEDKFEFVQFKAQTEFSASLESISQVVMNPQTYTLWLSDCIHAQKKDEHVYILMQPPWPLKKRQVLAKLHSKTYSHKKIITLVSLNRQKQNEEGIWFNYLYAEFLLEKIDKDQTRVTLSLLGDPGGFPPAWMVNLMAWQIPYKSLRDLKDYINLREKRTTKTSL